MNDSQDTFKVFFKALQSDLKKMAPTLLPAEIFYENHGTERFTK